MGLFDTYNSVWETTIRLAVAILLGAILGWERETKGRPAGLRTHMLVALGSAGLSVMSMELLARLERSDHPNMYDPLRLIDALIGGIGFLGAGAIIQAHGEVKGLTTAASLWIVAAMGIACGCGYFATALLMAFFGLVTLVLANILEKKPTRFVSNHEGD